MSTAALLTDDVAPAISTAGADRWWQSYPMGADVTERTEDVEVIVGWFIGRLPDDWFEDRPEFRVDRDEILLIGSLPDPAIEADDPTAVKAAAVESKVDGFRKRTRKRRIEIAREAERLFEKKVSWGVTCAGDEFLFATLAAPAMTRLRMDERQVLDTLIDAGVARSRSEALAWCVRLVGANESEWLSELEEALGAVRRARSDGPTV